MFHCAPPEVIGLGVMTDDVLTDQVIPGLDVLGVARSDVEDDDAVVDDAAVIVVVPVLGDDARLDKALDVRPQGQGQDVGRQPGLNSAALVARAGI